jgi:hypothetical protein
MACACALQKRIQNNAWESHSPRHAVLSRATSPLAFRAPSLFTPVCRAAPPGGPVCRREFRQHACPSSGPPYPEFVDDGARRVGPGPLGMSCGNNPHPLSKVVEGYVYRASHTKGGILRSPTRATRHGGWCRGDGRRVSAAVDMEGARLGRWCSPCFWIAGAEVEDKAWPAM